MYCKARDNIAGPTHTGTRRYEHDLVGGAVKRKPLFNPEQIERRMKRMPRTCGVYSR